MRRQLTEREKVQKKARQIGHCVCSTKFSCPCNVFRKTYRCHCAGDDTGMTIDEWVEANSEER